MRIVTADGIVARRARFLTTQTAGALRAVAGRRRLTVALCLPAFAGVLLWSAGAAVASPPARAGAGDRGTGLAGQPLSAALRRDGSLKRVDGNFDARGYRMVLGARGAPAFVKSSPRTAADGLSGSGALAAASASPSADRWWSDAFGNVGARSATTIDAVAVSGTDVYIGGLFMIVAPDSRIPMSNVAHWNGRGWSSLGAGAANGTNGTVRAIAVSDGSIYVGGDFTSAGGAAANRVARWTGTSWAQLGTGMSSPASGNTPRVNALAVAGSKLYAAGTFDDAGATVVHSLAAWNGTSWSAVGGGILNCVYYDSPGHCFRAPDSGTVNAILVSGTRVYVGGAFNQAASTLAHDLAVWNGASWSALGGGDVVYNGVSGTVNALAAGSGATIYAGGQFDSVGGINAASIASWDGAHWHPLGSGVTRSCSGCSGAGKVFALASHVGVLYASIDFLNQAGGDATPYLAKWNGTTWTSVGAGLDGTPQALTGSAAGVIAAGGFTKSGTVTLNNVGTWTGSSWSGYGFGLSDGGNAGNVGVVAIGGAAGRDVYAGGMFATAGSTSVKGVAHFSGTRWDNMGGGVNGPPRAIAINGSQVFVGGAFSQAGAGAAANIAMWDGATWHALRSGTDGPVLALLIYNGKLWVGGSFSHAGGGPANQLATYDLTSHLWAAVGGNPQFGSSGASSINALAGLAAPNNHYVVIGGQFLDLSDGHGASATVNSLVYFDTSAAVSTPFSGYFLLKGNGTAGTPGVITACGSGCSVPGAVNALLADGLQLYVGGSFDDAGNVASRGFAHFDFTSANPWSSPGPGGVGGGSGKGTVNALAKVGSSLYLGGDFMSAGRALASDVAQYTPATGVWSGLGSGLAAPGASPSVSTLANGTDGLYVGGVFGVSGSTGAENVALWTKTALSVPAVTSVNPTAGPVAGGNIVRLNGTNFGPGASVKFGTTAVASVTFVSATQLSVKAPTHTAGTVDVTVGLPAGSSAITSADRYTYAASPTVTSVPRPAAGTSTNATITGTK